MIKNEEVILIKLYKTSKTTSTSSSDQTSFIMDEVKNLAKYMKFIQAPIQTRIFLTTTTLSSSQIQR